MVCLDANAFLVFCGALSIVCFGTVCMKVNIMDEAVGNLTATLKLKQMHDNTLMLFSADNGIAQIQFRSL